MASPLTPAQLDDIQKTLFENIANHKEKDVYDILEANPELRNRKLNGNTPLIAAVLAHDVNIVEFLIVLSADRSIKNDEGKTALEIAFIEKDTAPVEGGEKRNAWEVYEFLESYRDDEEEEEAPSRALDFGDEPAVVLPKLEAIEVNYTEMPAAYDLLEMEDTPLFDLVTSGEKMIFKAKNLYFSTDLIPLRAAMKDKSSTFYECKKELDGAPYTKDVYMDTPYFRLSLNGNFTVPENQLQSALESKYSIFELVPSDKKLDFVSAFNSVQISPGVDGLGNQVDIMSADHCQKGSQQVTYTLKAVKMVKKKSGGKRRNTYRKGKKHMKRRTYRKH